MMIAGCKGILPLAADAAHQIFLATSHWRVVAVEASTFDKGEKLLITGNTTDVYKRQVLRNFHWLQLLQASLLLNLVIAFICIVLQLSLIHILAFEAGLPMDMGQILSIPLIIAGVWSIVSSTKRAKEKNVEAKPPKCIVASSPWAEAVTS